MKNIFSKTVIILSFVSFFNDISSEMLYPVLPIYLKSIGFSVLFISILESFSEALAGLSKGYFGKFSDSLQRRAPFVTFGYMLSAVSKPLLAFFSQISLVFSARTMDRFGKGIRTAARDAMLSENSTPENRASVFGLHRGMDTLGAVVGPLLALAYLSYFPEDYQTLFLIAFIPAATAVLLTFLLKYKPHDANRKAVSLKEYFSFFTYWKRSGKNYRLLTAGLFGFALVNSTDMLLLLMVKSLGYSDSDVIMVYVFYNLVLALSALPAGMLADRLGHMKSLIAGILVFSLSYLLIGFSSGLPMIYSAFVLYGLYPSLTDGVSKALISNISPKEHLGEALGFFTGMNSVFVLAAGLLAGIIWMGFGPAAVFFFSSAGAVAVVIYFTAMKTRFSQPSR